MSGYWTASEVDAEGNVWGIHRDDDGTPSLPKPGDQLPDGTYLTGSTPGGEYICADGEVLD